MTRSKDLHMMALLVCAGLLAFAPAATAGAMILQCENYRDGSNAPGGTDTDYIAYSYYDTTPGSQSDVDCAWLCAYR